YGELEGRANQLAHQLRALGVGAESVVGVCLERSLELVVALIAILKAGGAYLPLDPGYPRGRLSFMLADPGAAGVLTRCGRRRARTGKGGGARGGPRRGGGGWSLAVGLPRPRRIQRPPPPTPWGRTTSPTSSTPRAQPEHQKASRSSMQASPIRS